MIESPVSRAALPVARGVAIVAGWGLLIFALLTCVEIVGRKLFGFTLHGIDEIGGYALAVISSIGFSYTLIQRSHTRIDIFLTRLPPLAQAALNALASAALTAFALFAATRGWVELADSVDLKSVSSTPLQTPLWIPQAVWFAGLAAFAGIASALGVHALWLLATDWPRINRYYGPPTVEEEIAAETGRPLESTK